MNAHRAVLPTALLAGVLAVVLVADLVVGPPAATESTVPAVTMTDPRAGAALCTVGVGAPGEPATELPSPDDEDIADADDAEDAGDEAEAAEEDAADPADEDAPDPTEDAAGPTGDAGSPPPVATLIAARPPGAGSAPAQLERVDLVDGDRTATTLPAVFPGSDARTGAVRAQTPAANWLRWRDGVVAVSRQWRLAGVEGFPDATVAGGCTESSARTQVVPGLSTAGGDEARLRLANPHEGPASVAVRFATPGDPQAPLVLQNLSVAAGSVREVVVNTVLPERADLAALVEVTSGRVAVEGVQVARAAIGGVDGASLLTATDQPAEEWTVPWAVDDDATSSWLWVVNRGDRTAEVELTLHSEDGGDLPLGLTQVSVPAGELRRVDLTGTLPDGVREVAVTARSNGVPIVVSGGVRRRVDDVQRTGISVQLGASPDDRWVVSGTASERRRDRLRLVNPQGEAASVDITLFDGVRTLEPAELQGLALPAGSTRTVALEELVPPSARWSAFVTATTGQLVVGRVGSDGGDGPLHLVAGTGVPSASWTTAGSGLLPVPRPGLVTQLGTAGPRAGDVGRSGLLGDAGEADETEDPATPDAPEDPGAAGD